MMGAVHSKSGGPEASATSTVAASYALSLLDFAVSNGADRERLYDAAGIDSEALRDPDKRISFDKYKALMGAAKLLTGDPALALRFGQFVDMTQVSLVGGLGAASETVADAFVMFGHYIRLLVDIELEPEAKGERLVLRRASAGTWLVDMRRDPNDFPELTESSFARMAASTARFTGRSFFKAVEVTHPPPPYQAEYDRIFGVPVTFNAGQNAVLLGDDSWKSIKPPLPSTPVLEVLARKADVLLDELDAEKTVRGRAEKLLGARLEGGELTMASIAAALGMSKATLFRRLAAEGTTFEEVLDELRRGRAERLVSRGELPLTQIAHALGFSELASFSRAYRRWFGLSPRSARRPVVHNATRS
jgi:AraC-like DNA-binding protein